MKPKIIIYTFFLTVLLLSGCTQRNTNNNEVSSEPNSSSNTTTETSETLPSAQPQIVGTENGTVISEEEARTIALTHAGLTAEQVTFIKIGIDRDNGKLRYEGKIYYEQTEYEFEIDGYSGTIIEWDEEPVHSNIS